MAARWGAGEETLTACTMDYFPLDTLCETAELCSGGPLEGFQSCLDLSIFDETPSIETKGLDEDSEAMLLTALTEILDNVDDENLSPFDTLPESEILTAHKGREHSPLRRLLCVPLSPSEKDSFSTRPQSTGKNLPRIPMDSLQRSDGEEEDASSLTLSPGRHGLPSDWEGLALPFPVTFDQESDNGLPVSLGDFVRHMHPYCMALCLENDEGVQMLPEGGILLEVVDQGENGEPILAVPDMGLQGPPPLDKFAGDEDVASDTSEHIVVDDDDVVNVLCKAPANTQSTCSDKVINTQKKETMARVPSRKKKKKKKQCPPDPVPGRVLRSAALRNQTVELPQKPEKKRIRKEKKNKIPKASVAPVPAAVKPVKISCQSKTQVELHTRETSVAAATFVRPKQETGPTKAGVPESPVTSPQSKETAQPVSQAPSEGSSPPPLVYPSSPASAFNIPALTVNEPLPPVTPALPELKPKSLSLAEYRQLRRQKKPVLLEKQGDNSTKWPSLPEPPKQLTPIPCLPDPSPKDLRRSTAQAVRDVVDIKPAWQPRGPCAPPTPEALLVPPAYMVKSANKSVTAVSKQSQESQARSPPQKPSVSTPDLVTPQPHTSKCQSGMQSPEMKTVPKLSDAPFGKISPPTNSEMACSAVVPVPQKTPVIQNAPELVLTTPTTLKDLGTSAKFPAINAKHCSAPPLAYQIFNPQAAVLKANKSVTTPVEPLTAKSPTQELIESFTSEIGIEAADLTSLLEQFEETQAKEQQSVPEVCGRAAAVGNSSAEFARERSVLERVRANDLSSPAALTPPATPPHQMWKPLAPVALLGKTKVPLSKTIQIDARPLPSSRFHSKPTAAAAPVSPDVVCMDHDYCLPSKGNGEPGKRWNVKQQTFITIKPIKPPAAATTVTLEAASQSSTQAPEALGNGVEGSSVLETPEASPAWQENESTFKESATRKGHFERSYGCHAASRTPSPTSSTKERGRKRRVRRSPSVSSSLESDSRSSRSRSRSHSPPKKRYRHRRSRGRSSSTSRSSSRSSVSCSPPRRRRYSYSSSHSGSWSRSRSRSHSPQRCATWGRNGRLYSPSYRTTYGHRENTEDTKRRKEKAIEERRVVYIGRIRGTMTQRELRERFSYFGKVEDCTLHFRDHGDNYGFVTYYNTKDAFTAIENGSKLRKPDELPFDLCFGGRRQFCKTGYSDLDSNRDYEPLSTKSKAKTLDFDTLLKQAQQSLKR
ncbi:peroxisome proliferator-activated receptor gamma coactivator-related protein 1 isoform X1 [Nerophis ophidion]|uniref:peroxisome proliferator-activated receptor gamma coactivator-related protein 1 isoform X1 n=1 Tax=Nerophis ophidion TaxID=159077 RepID=UPI002AE0A880|nr:peroxisome proliferator-activated receptor gamma coactivator-related protein 1 isoform X1 [Nerophis ophidion]